MNNLPAHKGTRVETLIKAAPAPAAAYSLDFYAIENDRWRPRVRPWFAFAKLKTLLREAAAPE